MRVLVTGATGFVGRALVNSLGREHEVVAVCRNPAACPPAAVCVSGDLAAGGRLAALDSVFVDAVVHLAQSPHYRDFPGGAPDVYAVNVGSTAQMLDWAVRRGVRRFVLASSGAVYEPFEGPLSEDDAISPSTMYATSKAAAECIARPYGELLELCVLRLFFPYGPGQVARLIPTLFERIAAGDAVTIEGASGSGTVVRPIHVADVVRVFQKALTDGWNGTFNVAGREVVSIETLAHMIGEVVRQEPRFAYDAGARPANIDPELDRLGAVFDLASCRTLGEGLAGIAAPHP